MKLPRCLVSMSLVVSISASTQAQEHSLEVEPIRNRILESWASLDTSIKTCSYKWSVEYHRADDANPSRLTSRETGRYLLSQGGSVFEYIRAEESPSKTFLGNREISNDRYSAKMTKAKSGGEWVLSGHDKPDPLKPEYRRNVIFPWSLLANFQLTDWLVDPQVAFSRVERPGGSIVRLHFALKDGGKPVAPTVRSGHFDFDEANHFHLAGYRINRKDKFSDSVETCECHYDISKPIPVLIRAIIEVPEWRSEKHGTLTSRRTRTYEIEYNGEISDDEFWLSHYGFPEPVGVVREKPTPRYLWLLLATGAFLALAIGFRYLARRRAARGRATTIA